MDDKKSGAKAPTENSEPETVNEFNLDVHEFADPAIKEIRETMVPKLALAYDPEKSDWTFSMNTLGGWVSDARSLYVAKVEEVSRTVADKLTELRDSLRKASPIMKIEETMRTVLAIKASTLCKLREKAKPAADKLRRMNIGMTGNPERGINLDNATNDIILIVTFSIAVLAFEFGLNLATIQQSTSLDTAALVSIIFSIATIVGTFFAASKRQERYHYQNALVECARYYSNKPGRKDPVLNEKPYVFPLSAGHSFKFWGSHAIGFGAPLTLIIIRSYLINRQVHPNWLGGLSGSLAVLLATIVVYFIKISMPGTPEKVRVDEYRELKAEVDADAEEMETLKNPIATTDESGAAIMAAWTRYNDDMGPLDGGEEAKIVKTIATLRTQAGEADEYFVHAFTWCAQTLADKINGYGVGKFEIPTNPAETYPGLVTPINMGALDELGATPPVERLREWHTTARNIWGEVLQAEEVEVAAQKKATAQVEGAEARAEALRDIRNFRVEAGRAE